jgi:NADPH-dependent glutamate synthase beta subunit-like oxidoreductase
VDVRRCTECHACVEIGCPALSVAGTGRVVIDDTLCTACGLCTYCCNDCNTGLAIGRLLELVSKGRDADALSLILDVNPLPAVSARVCPHPCDHAVNALGRDQHAEYAERYPGLVQRFGDPKRPGRIAVRAVERYLGDLLIDWPDLVPIERLPATRGTVAIIGSGPSGLSAAWQLARRGVSVSIYDAAAEPGGVLRSGIPGFRLERHVLNAEIRRVLNLGVSYYGNVRIGVDMQFADLRSVHDAVIVAVGYGASRDLPLEGAEGAAGMHTGTTFLRRYNGGEPVELGRRVAVIGGGNTAMDCARAARRSGAEVTVYYRRGEAEMPAIPDEIAAARDEGVEIVTLALPTRVITDADRRVRALEVVRMELGAVDESGRRAPVPMPDSTRVVDADSVIIAVGELADLSLLEDSGVHGHARVDVTFTGRTSMPDVFACGDVAFGHGTVTQGIATGRRTADAVLRYLKQQKARS